MKKKLGWIIVWTLLLFATASCSSYFCPTYSDVRENAKKKVARQEQKDKKLFTARKVNKKSISLSHSANPMRPHVYKNVK